MSRVTPRKTKTPVRIPFKIFDGGHEDDHQVTRTLTYPKPIAKWTAADLLKVSRTMALAAARFKRKKIGRDTLQVHVEGRNGGTSLTVSHQHGAWARIKGSEAFRLPTAALAGLVSVAEWHASAYLTLPRVVKPHAATVRAEKRELHDLISRLSLEPAGGAR